ncbi:dihydropteroate synthase [Sphingomonas cavernae]|uniref:dihydropteroate synthase n=1 Tax=Sphingomonas cavernae TaxID=2320861 RepID=A0A418WNG4_9SPHN|nr:dihydropteroate synthase [Sphingomonas cavernae]RJF91527.1 dihydropteroate synthase [Sphingomonas cavernae]
MPVDSPVGLDGRVARLAGGLNWFAGYELIAIADGRRVFADVIAVERLDEAIAALPDGQAGAIGALRQRIEGARAPLQLGERVLRFDQPHVAGILNVTPDSFSDGGAYHDDPASAAAAGVAMAAEGAALIDLGGESTRPGSQPVWEGDEVARVVPVIERMAASGTAISIDTRKAAVMEAALAAGAHIVNDVAALLYDERALEVVAKAGCPVVLMHSPDPKSGGHGEHRYGDVLLDVYDWLEARIAAVVAGGVAREKIIVDPGIGFGKSLQENLQLVNGLALLHGLGCPIMLGVSRKRMIGALSGEAPADKRLAGSVMLAVRGAELGAQILRVHDVAETVQAIRVWRGLRDAAMMPRGIL